jgi:hypothetical protein
MRTIADLNLLLRAQADLPAGLKITTEDFHEGWSFVRAANALRLEKKIRTRGWNFIRVADGSLRSGVGETAHDAIAAALKLALRQLHTQVNALEVEQIELTRYPWFFLAKLRLHPYRIQPEAELPFKDAAFPDESGPRSSRRGQPANPAGEPVPQFAGAMPMLKDLLLSSANS